MILLDLIQGNDEWKAHRFQTRNASEASMIVGVHGNVKRNEILRLKATGSEQEFSNYVQKNVLDNGHRVEALARTIIEGEFDVTLKPIVATTDDGYLGASLDGFESFDRWVWECKQWNKEKAESVIAGTIPESDFWQTVQQMVVTETEKVLYTVSDGTPENTVSTWYDLTQDDVDTLYANWKQFDVDLADYKHVEPEKIVIAEVVKTLPAVQLQVTGEITLSNLDDIVPMFDAFISGAIVVFETDQHFADAEAQSRVARAAAKQCEVAINDVTNLPTLGDIILTLRLYQGKLNKLALAQEKAVKAAKESIKDRLAIDAIKEFTDHVAALNAEITPIALKIATPGFSDAMKGKRTKTSLVEAVSTLLANSKVSADMMATKFRKNLAYIRDNDKGFNFLFSDLQQIINNDYEAFTAIVNNRVTQHESAEQKKADDQREKMRVEEEAKAIEKVRLEQEANAKAIADQAALVERERLQEVAKQKAIDDVVVARTEADRLADTARRKAIDEANKKEVYESVVVVEPKETVKHESVLDSRISSPPANNQAINQAFVALDYVRTLTYKEDIESIKDIFGEEEIGALSTDENGTEYDLQITIKRVAMKKRKAA